MNSVKLRKACKHLLVATKPYIPQEDQECLVLVCNHVLSTLPELVRQRRFIRDLARCSDVTINIAAYIRLAHRLHVQRTCGLGEHCERPKQETSNAYHLGVMRSEMSKYELARN